MWYRETNGERDLIKIYNINVFKEFVKYIFIRIMCWKRREYINCSFFSRWWVCDIVFSGAPFLRVRTEVSCWSDWQNDDRHLGGARGLGPHAATRDCRRVRIRRGKLEFETFRTLTYQGTSWYETLPIFFSNRFIHIHFITIIFCLLQLFFYKDDSAICFHWFYKKHIKAWLRNSIL